MFFRRTALAPVIALMALLLPAPGVAEAPPVAPTTTSATAADRLLGRDRDAAFDTCVRFITDVHAVSRDGARRLGVPWEDALASGRRRFREARSVDDVYYALLSVQRTLRDGHARFRRNELPVTFGPPVELDFEADVRYAGPGGGPHRYMVVRSGEPLLPVGSTIAGCDGLAMAAFESRLLEWYDRHSPEGFREFTARNLSLRKPQSMPAPAPGDTARFACLGPDGSPFAVALAWRAVSDADGSRADVTNPDANGSSSAWLVPPGVREPSRFDAQYRGFPLEAAGLFWEVRGTRAEDTKILRYVSFNYAQEQDFSAEVDALARHLRASGARRVLVDVRDNGGGAFDPALVGVFTSRPFRIMLKSFHYGARVKADPQALGRDPGLELWTPEETRLLQADLAAHPAADWSRPVPFFCRTAACGEEEAVVRFDGSPGYDTVVLCGPNTFSSGDMFVTIMKDNGIARLAGMPSGAGDAPYRWTLDYPLADGTRITLRLTTAVSYRPNSPQVIIEGNPPALDIPLYPTCANAEAFLDSVLAAAWPR